MTKLCIDIKKTLSCVYYELKYYYNYYFNSSNRMNDYNYAPLSEIIIDHQPDPRTVPKRYTSPPPFNTSEKVVETTKINYCETHPKIGITENIRKRPSMDFIENTETVLSPISERSSRDYKSDTDSDSLSSPNLNIKIEITDTDLKCEIESDSDDNWELLTDKND